MTDNHFYLVDFDGTITEVDTDVFIARKLLKGRELDRFEALLASYENTDIGLLEYFDNYLKLVSINDQEFVALALETPVRSNLVSFLIQNTDRVAVVSEGLDVYIEPLLATHGLSNVQLICNRVKRKDSSLEILSAPDAEPCDRCLSCKGALARRMKSADPSLRLTIIGNGASDLCAARVCDQVHARDSLARLCDKEEIPYINWQDGNLNPGEGSVPSY